MLGGLHKGREGEKDTAALQGAQTGLWSGLNTNLLMGALGAGTSGNTARVVAGLKGAHDAHKPTTKEQIRSGIEAHDLAKQTKETPVSKQAEMTENEKVLFNQVYVPAMIEKLASRGIAVNTLEDLNEILDNTALLKQAQVKTQGSAIKQASVELRKSLNLPESSAPAAVKQSEELVAYVKSSASELSKNPALMQAALSA